MRKIIFYILLSLGIFFFINAIFGRYIVLPGYFQSLESGAGSANSIPEGYPVWKIVRYLVWAFSFKLGALLILAAFLTKNSFSARLILLMVFAGLFYISTAFIPITSYMPLFFGIGGGIITIVFCLLTALGLNKDNPGEHGVKLPRLNRLLFISAVFMFAMATYNLCPLLGIKVFALHPEKMITYGLQEEAVSFATHVMIELTAGWLLLLLSRLPWKKKSEVLRSPQQS